MVGRVAGHRLPLEPIASDVEAWFAELDRLAEVSLFEAGRNQPATPVGQDFFA